MRLVTRALETYQEEGIYAVMEAIYGFVRYSISSMGRSKSCPVCGWTGRKFASGGTPERK